MKDSLNTNLVLRNRDILGLVSDDLKKAGDIALSCFRKSDLKKSFKNEGGLVTEADRKIQDFLKGKLGKIFKKSVFIAEEDPTELIEKNHILSQQPFWFWVIDPLDGTNSFAKGSDNFGLQVALGHQGTLLAGWIYCPAQKRFACADISTATVTEGFSISCKKQDKESGLSSVNMVLASGDFDKEHLEKASENAKKVNNARRTFSCAVDYMDLLEGNRDLLVYKRSLIWDHAPGIFLVRMAGGEGDALRFDYSSYRPFDGKQGLIVARSRQMLETGRLFSP